MVVFVKVVLLKWVYLFCVILVLFFVSCWSLLKNFIVSFFEGELKLEMQSFCFRYEVYVVKFCMGQDVLGLVGVGGWFVYVVMYSEDGWCVGCEDGVGFEQFCFWYVVVF